MQDKGLVDGFLRVIKYQSLENVKGINNFINFDDKAKAVSSFFDNVINIGTKPFRRKKTEPVELSQVDEDCNFMPEIPKAATKDDNYPKTSQIENISSIRLIEFADMGSMTNVISKLHKIALPERWDIEVESLVQKNKNAILHKYFHHTFGRAVYTSQIVVDEFKTMVIFNTGLVDCHYQPIYALFIRNNPRLKQEWRFKDFFVVGSGIGKRILEFFNPSDLPKAPQYFDDFCDLLYDFRKGEPTPDYQHCIIDNIHRWPQTVHEHECPAEWAKIDKKITCSMPDKEKGELFQSLRSYVNDNKNVYRQYKSRFDDAIELAFKKVTWNYKTAIPMYWSVDKRIHLLLPLCLDSEDSVDAALVVNKTEKGYIGDTILTLGMAYMNARLVCRPECDWLDTEGS